MSKILTIALALSAISISSPVSAKVQTASIQIDQESSGLTIKIANLQVADSDIKTRGDRLYIDLNEVSIQQKIELDGDRTVRGVQIAGGRRPRLIVRIGHGREKTKAIGLAATVENIAGGIVMHIPRWPIQAVRPELHVVSATPEVAPTVAKSKSAEAPIDESPADIGSEKSDILPGSKDSEAIHNEELAEEEPEPIVLKAAAQAPSSEIVGKESPSGSSTGLIVGFLLLIAGAGFVTWRSRKKDNESDDYENLRVVASKQLGGKSKVVWLSVADRELVIAVGEGGTHLLSEWKRNEELLAIGDTPIPKTLLNMESSLLPEKPSIGRGSSPMPIVRPEHAVSLIPEKPPEFRAPIRSPDRLSRRTKNEESKSGRSKMGGGLMGGYRFQSALSRAQTNHQVPDEGREVAPERISAQSPALAGLVRLRAQAPSINDDVATQDEVADAEWARELLRATRDSVLQDAG